MPSITIREYNPESGALLGNVSSLKFGKIPAGTRTNVKVIDIAFGEAENIGNLKIGLISNAGITVNESPEDIGVDGSSSNGNFGIEDTTSFNAAKSSEPLTRYFPGLNSTATASDSNNVSLGMRNDTISNYIYLDIKVGASLSGSANGSYKIFFDYS